MVDKSQPAGSARAASERATPAISRRQFLLGAGGLGLAWLLARGAADQPAAATAPAPPLPVLPPAPLPTPTTSGIEHVVVVMMENRSFDHFLGWLPGADGRQAGLTYFDRNNMPHNTYPLAPDFQGCGRSDPHHSYAGGRVEYDNGACDGWLRAGSNDLFSIGYYTQADLSFLGQHAPYWTTCDHYFAAIMSETYPNRFFQHAAQSDRLANAAALSTLPTIWDRLAARGVSAQYYYSDVPVLALWGSRYVDISQPFSQFLADCAAGTLPAVSFVDPQFLGEDQGTSADDHPFADIRNGEAFLDQVYHAVTTGPGWANTLLILNYDEWGGFFDHVAPPVAPLTPYGRLIGNADGLRGFRVPCLLISPWSPRGTVAHDVYDHTAVLKLIEWRWSLDPLTVRDATANNLAQALDFAHPDLTAPAFVVPPGPFGGPCPPTDRVPDAEWAPVLDLARRHGWPV